MLETLKYMFYIWLSISIIFIGFGVDFIREDIKETQAIILEYQSKLTAVETEKQKTIADFLRSVTGRERG